MYVWVHSRAVLFEKFVEDQTIFVAIKTLVHEDAVRAGGGQRLLMEEAG